MKKIFIFMSLIIIAGCTWVGTVESVKTIHTGGSVNPNAGFYMIYPRNEMEKAYDDQAFEDDKNSATKAVGVFYNKFHKAFGALTVTQTHIPLEEGFKQAKLRGDKYLISMEIHDWIDVFYMTCRNNNPKQTANAASVDRLDVSIRVYDVKTKALLNDQRLQNSGCPFVLLGIIPVGKMGPDSRFDDALDTWFNTLLQE